MERAKWFGAGALAGVLAVLGVLFVLGRGDRASPREVAAWRAAVAETPGAAAVKPVAQVSAPTTAPVRSGVARLQAAGGKTVERAAWSAPVVTLPCPEGPPITVRVSGEDATVAGPGGEARVGAVTITPDAPGADPIVVPWQTATVESNRPPPGLPRFEVGALLRADRRGGDWGLLGRWNGKERRVARVAVRGTAELAWTERGGAEGRLLLTAGWR